MTQCKTVRIGLPRKILYRGSAGGLPGEVLGAPPGSRRVLSQGRVLLRWQDKEEASPPDTKVRQMKMHASLKPDLGRGRRGHIGGRFLIARMDPQRHCRTDGARASSNRCRWRAGPDLRREIPASGRSAEVNQSQGSVPYCPPCQMISSK